MQRFTISYLALFLMIALSPSAIAMSADEALQVVERGDKARMAEALETLTKNGDRKMFDPVFDRFVQESDSGLFQAFADCLIKADPKKAGREIVRDIDEDDFVTVERAVKVVKRVGGKDNIKRLVELIGYPYSGKQRAILAEGLKPHMKDTIKAITKAVAMVRDELTHIRYLDFMGAMRHDDSTRVLLNTLFDKNDNIVDAAIKNIKKIGEPAFNDVLEAWGSGKSTDFRLMLEDLMYGWSKVWPPSKSEESKRSGSELRAVSKDAKVWVQWWDSNRKRIMREYESFWKDQEKNDWIDSGSGY